MLNKNMDPKKQIEIIKNNISGINCPIVLFDMNKKYNELINKVTKK